ncbi:hypothetical protein GCM10027445_27020 [Amycolatopsis endophytica]|uniref:Uncharacterized protein n=1 Tax=Amycolatopsis endophytica TaxID=860233 RepID=A0A853B5D8_9PSEU|nr:hypothetical protein [Amycolatopsis endophytica]NYI90279.1 hypothetical protein [Amycolatopsis endophytica]
MSTVTEPETIADLIDDCADFPTELRAAQASAPRPPAPRAWSVDDTCHAQVVGLEDY